MTGCTRRIFGLGLTGIALPGCDEIESLVKDSPTVEKAKQYAQQHLPANRRREFAKIARQVEREYTTQIVRYRHQDRIYDIPANFISYVGKSRFREYKAPNEERYELPDPAEYLGDWFFFYPDFNGFTTENWFDSFDRRKIRYSYFQVVKEPEFRSTTDLLNFRQITGQVESRPSVELSGLSGYRFKSHRDLVWIGVRGDGQMFMMESFDPRDRSAFESIPNPSSKVRMHDPVNREIAVYQFSLDLLEHWREIDTRTQLAINRWRVR